MKTERLYEADAYCAAFTAQVADCRQAGAAFQVVLDRTAFYPEGGGQPGDTGFLGRVRVLDTQEHDGQLFHLTDGPLEVGRTVEGRLDWARRFDLMQQHSGEHIVSGLVHARYGYDNVGFHLGSELVTIDLNGELTEEGLKELEDEANRMIWKDISSEITYPGPEELKSLSYRSKKELTGRVRIVTVPGLDCCACCGTHVTRTGEIGLIKLLSCQKFRSGVRVELLCGGRALAWLNRTWQQNSRVSQLLSAKPEETGQAVERLLEEHQRLKGQLYAAQERQFAQRAEALSGTGDVLLFENAMEPDALRRLAAAVMEQCGGRCAVFAGRDESGYKYAMGQKGGDLRQLVKELNAALSGRGGGKPFFAQGSVAASRREIEAFFAP